NIGSSLDDQRNGNFEKFATNATVAHIDIDPAEIGKNVATDIPVVADAKKALEALLNRSFEKQSHRDWLVHLKANQAKFPLWHDNSSRAISPQSLIHNINEKTEGKEIVTTDVGQHQMWAAQYYTMDEPHRWVTSGGLGAMGYGFPSAIGAQIGRPDELVVSINGDGGIQMNIQELLLLKKYNLPV